MIIACEMISLRSFHEFRITFCLWIRVFGPFFRHLIDVSSGNQQLPTGCSVLELVPGVCVLVCISRKSHEFEKENNVELIMWNEHSKYVFQFEVANINFN